MLLFLLFLRISIGHLCIKIIKKKTKKTLKLVSKKSKYKINIISKQHHGNSKMFCRAKAFWNVLTTHLHPAAPSPQLTPAQDSFATTLSVAVTPPQLSVWIPTKTQPAAPDNNTPPTDNDSSQQWDLVWRWRIQFHITRTRMAIVAKLLLAGAALMHNRRILGGGNDGDVGQRYSNGSDLKDPKGETPKCCSKKTQSSGLYCRKNF